MLLTRNVGPGWTRYCGKQRNADDPPIQPGLYFEYTGRRPAEATKRSLGLIACRDERGSFKWLAVAEPWVKHAMDGMLPMAYPQEASVDLRQVFGCYDKLRAWQQRWVASAVATLERGGEYRRVASVPLGGGKTLAGLAMLALGDHGLVVAPTYIHNEWKNEAVKWGFAEPTTTTYESAYKWTTDLDVLILDELHLVKNPDALRHQRILELSRRAKIVVGFTGSLMGARGPLDLRSLRVISSGCLPASDVPFRFIFGTDTRLEEVAPGRSAYVTTQWDHQKITEWVSPWVMSVDIAELQSDLPEISYRTVMVRRPKDYELVSRGGATATTKSKRTAQMRQCTDGFVLNDQDQPVRLSTEKLDAVEGLIEDAGEPVIVYASWTESVAMLRERFKDYTPSVLDGSTRDQGFEIERFRRSETKLLIANSRFSAGMNLQDVCRTIIFVSLSTNPIDHKQAIGRVYRPGQRRGVQIIYLQAENTIDKRAHDLVTGHEELSQQQIEALLEKEVDNAPSV